MAEYSTIILADAAEILGEYGLKPTSVELLAGGMANTSYVIRTEDAAYVLTILDNHNLDSAKSLVSLIDYVIAAGVETPYVLHADAGKEVVIWQKNPVILKPYIAGRPLNVLPESLLLSVGRLLASIHSVPPPPSLPPKGRHLPRDWRNMMAERACAALYQEILAASDNFAAEEFKNLPAGLVHGDLFGDNLLLTEDKKIIALDWETATIEPFVLDIGICAVAFCRTAGQLDKRRFLRILAGYEERRIIGEEERSSLLASVRYANAMLAYHRYIRHNIRYPDPVKADLYQELLDFAHQLPTHLENISSQRIT